MTPSTSLSKSELVYRELRQRIISGRYTTGYRLVLDQIAREMGVSPVPVREAIRRLEAEGLVTFTRNVGAEVTSIDVDDYANTMFVLAYLEGAATALSAANLTKEQLDEATDTNDQMRALTDSSNFDARLYTSLNGRFHQQLCQACPNERLNGLITREAERITVIRRTTFSFSQERSRKSVIEHDHLLNLIRSGASYDDIDRAAREHKMFAMREYVRRTSED